MSRGPLVYRVPINVLIRDDGVRELLIAIDYFRGGGGKYAEPVRDALAKYAGEFRDTLGAKDQKVFDEILSTVKTTEAYRKDIKGG